MFSALVWTPGSWVSRCLNAAKEEQSHQLGLLLFFRYRQGGWLRAGRYCSSTSLRSRVTLFIQAPLRMRKKAMMPLMGESTRSSR